MSYNLNGLDTKASPTADQDIEITIYTDPLCCWSWAFEPQLQLLKDHLQNRAHFIYKMGGLLSSWNNYYDEANAVSRPVQMGPVWMHAGQVSGQPIYHQIWMKDPPASSYPACIAVKCAQLQSVVLGEQYLYMAREACMISGKNIARQEVLHEVAEQLAQADKRFNVERFKQDLSSERGMNAFRTDLEQARQYNISRFPTLIIKSPTSRTILVSGYGHYTTVLKAMSNVIEGIEVDEKTA